MINQILPDLYRITLPMPFRLRHVHIHALVHDDKVTLFDVGMNIPESFRVLDEALATLGKCVDTLAIVLILIAASSAFGFCLTRLHVPDMAARCAVSGSPAPM